MHYHSALPVQFAGICLLFTLTSCAMFGDRARVPRTGPELISEKEIWPEPFPAIGRHSVRPALTAKIRRKTGRLGLNGVTGPYGEKLSRVLALLPADRAKAGVVTFEIEKGPRRGVHQCEALGRGSTSLTSKAGWIPGTIQEPDGRETKIFYAPQDHPSGATQPGVYDIRNMRPAEYKISFLNSDISGEEELAERLRSPDEDEKPLFTGVWKHWYPRDPEYSDLAPVDMLWSSRYQRFSQGADVPVFELPNVKKVPDQADRNPRYYTGPNGRYGFAIHTDRWDDRATAMDPVKAARNEFRSFLFRDTSGCLKVRPDCLQLINEFIDEQMAHGHTVQLEVREIRGR